MITLTSRLSKLTFCLLLLTFVGCGANRPKHHVQSQNSQDIQLSHVWDLGSRAFFGNTFQMPQKADWRKLGDRRYSPGELLVLEGRFPEGMKVRLDNQLLSPLMQSSREVAVRLPANMLPFEKHTIELQNGEEQRSWQFSSSHYLAVSDTDGNQLVFVRSNPDSKGGFDKPGHEIKQKRALFNQFSADRSLLFSLSVDSKTKSIHQTEAEKRPLVYGLLLKAIDMNHPDNPVVFADFRFQMRSVPVAMSMNQHGQLLVLARNDFTIIDTRQPARMQLLQQQWLPLSNQQGKEFAFVDGEWFAADKKIGLLETNQNQLFVYDIPEKTPPKLEFVHSLDKTQTLPIALDLLRDPQNDHQLWVLLGANVRQLGQSLYKQTNSLISDGADSTPGQPIDERVVRLEYTEGQLKPLQSIALPDNFVPFFMSYRAQGSFFISGLNGSYFDYDDNAGWNEQLQQLGKMLVGSFKPGRILTVNVNAEEVKTHLQGVGIYYDVTEIPGKGAAFSLLKLTGSIWPPFVKAAWGFGIENRGTWSYRSLETEALFPPYSVGEVSFQ